MTEKKNFVVVALGSNIEPRKKYIDYALINLNLNNKSFSRIYETEPMLPNYSDSTLSDDWYSKFFNCVVCGYTAMKPLIFLKHCKALEMSCGKLIKKRWGPRTIDLDILFWNSEVINYPNLVIPHYGIHERYFVLKPLNDVIPGYIHPILKKTIRELLEEL